MGRAFGVTFDGLVARVIEVEAGDDLTTYTPAPRQVREGLARVRAALGRPEIGVILPPGVAWDPPLDLAVVAAATDAPADCCYVGEVTLKGRVLPVRGALAAVEAATAKRLYPVVPVDSLLRVVGHHYPAALGVTHVSELRAPPPCHPDYHSRPARADYRDQEARVRAVALGLQGREDVLLVGSAESGMMRVVCATGHATLDRDTAYEVDVAHDLAGLAVEPIRHAPLRVPHHTVSVAGMLGLGSRSLPGEIHLAHGGTLVLDLLHEWSRDVLEAVAAARRNPGPLPARFRLVAITYACPCGRRPGRGCRCTPADVVRHQARVDGCCRLLGIERRVEVV